MKVLIGLVKTASQPYFMAKGLRKRGIEAKYMLYSNNPLDYESDNSVELKSDGIERAMIFRETITTYGIYHFFQHLFFLVTPRRYDKLKGFDIPPLVMGPTIQGR